MVGIKHTATPGAMGRTQWLMQSLGLLTGVGMWFGCGSKFAVHEKKWEADLQGEAV